MTEHWLAVSRCVGAERGDDGGDKAADDGGSGCSGRPSGPAARSARGAWRHDPAVWSKTLDQLSQIPITSLLTSKINRTTGHSYLSKADTLFPREDFVVEQPLAACPAFRSRACHHMKCKLARRSWSDVYEDHQHDSGNYLNASRALGNLWA